MFLIKQLVIFVMVPTEMPLLQTSYYFWKGGVHGLLEINMNAPPALQSQTIVGRKGALMEVQVTFLESKLGTSSQVKVYQTIFSFYISI